MNLRYKKLLFCIILCIILIFTSAQLSFALNDGEAERPSVYDILTGGENELLCVSKYGNIESYPENSAEGIASANEQGADIVMVSVKKTADGVIVLFKDDNLSRMCADASGSSVDKTINEVSFEELKGYNLKNGKGGINSVITAYSIPTLEDIIREFSGKAVLLIEGGWSFRDEIKEIIFANNARSSVILLADKADKDTAQWIAGEGKDLLVFTHYNGTVIWNSSVAVKRSGNFGAKGILLTSGNPYSTTFSKSVAGKTGNNLKAVADMTDKKLCGKREDTLTYLEDMTSRGFSVFITDNVQQFTLYKERLSFSRERLAGLIEKANKADLSACSSKVANSFNKQVSAASKLLDTSVCALELDNCCTALNTAILDLSDSVKSTKGDLTVSAGRIIAAVVIVIAFIASEIIFEHYKNRNIALRHQGKLRKKRNKKDIELP